MPHPCDRRSVGDAAGCDVAKARAGWDTRPPVGRGGGSMAEAGSGPRAENLFRGLVEAAPDAIVAVSTDGLIMLVNAQAERLFGYSRDELVGQRVEMLVPEKARSIHPARRVSYLVDPKPRSMGAGMELAGR